MSQSFKYNASTLRKIEDILHASEYVVRYERGNFNSGYCILEQKKVIVINKFYDTEARINCLIDLMGEVLILEDNLDEKQLRFLQKILARSGEEEE